MAPLNPSKKGRGSSPPKANPAFAGNVVCGPSPKTTDKTLGVSLSAVAKSSSLLGRPAIAAVTAFAFLGRELLYDRLDRGAVWFRK